MGKNILNKIKIKSLKIMRTSKGDVMHVLKKNEVKNWSFKEAYFSKIKYKKIKAWKFHLKMTSNLTVPYGKVKFVFYLPKRKKFKVVDIGEKKYLRITVPPRIWFGFKGMSRHESIILNLTNMQHNPKEVLKCNKSKIKFNW